ncbi:MAG: hypothetical protein NVS3B15_14560 [Sediminibacterium sp.]
MPSSRHIVLFGAGKSATVLIGYLKTIATEKLWKVTVADGDGGLAGSKVGQHPLVTAVALDINNRPLRNTLVQQADVVISLLPPSLHYLVALDCIAFQKHLLTASYLDNRLRAMEPAIQQHKLLFLCEMGLDPGIDHMSAMQLIHRIEAKAGKILSFRSHCGTPGMW